MGTATVTVRATDLSGAFVEDQFDIVIANTNDAPTVANPIADQSANEDSAFSFQFAVNTFADVDVSDTLTYSASGIPGWLSFNSATRTFTGTPANPDVGSYTVTVRATDLAGTFVEDQFDIVVANTNDAPTGARWAPVYLSALTPVSSGNILGGLTVNSGFNFNLITLDGMPYAHGVGMHAPLAGVGTAVYALNGATAFRALAGISDTIVNGGSVTMRAYVDGVLAFDSGTLTNASAPLSVFVDTTGGTTLTLEVGNSDGALDADHAVWVDARLIGSNHSLTTLTLAENAATGSSVGFAAGADADLATTFNYTLVDNAGGRFAINAATGEVSVINGALLNFEAATNHIIIVRVSDGALSFDQAMTIALTRINEAPVGADKTIAINEDTPYALAAVDFGFSDVDVGDTLLWVRIDSLQTAGSLTLNGVQVSIGQSIFRTDIDAGSVVFTPGADASGAGYATFSFTVEDSGQLRDAAPKTITFDVSAANDAPTLAVNTALTLNEGASATITNLLLRVSDVDNTAAQLAYTVIGMPANGSLRLSGVALAANGTFTQADINAGLVTYQHDSSQTTSDAFTVTVSDGAGGSIGASAFILSINAVNDTPTLNANTGTTVNEGASVSISNVQLAVSDVDNTPAQLVYTVTSIPANGALRSNGVAVVTNGTFTQADINAGLLTYQHNGSETLSDNFTFTVTDGAGGAIGSSTFAITVSPVNDAPTGATWSPVYLSSLTPVSTNNIYVGLTVNSGYLNNAITVDGTSYAHGIGMHAPVAGVGTAVYALNGATEFRALAGISDAIVSGGSVAMRAYVDGVLAFDSGLLTNATAPVSVLINTAGGTSLTLEVGNANGSINEDHAVWADARLIGSNYAQTTIMLAEQATTGSSVGFAAGADPDAGTTFGYSLVNDASGRFAINATTGEVTVADGARLNFEAATSHNIVVQVSDGAVTFDQAMTIALSEINETPSGADKTIAINEDTSYTLNAADFGFSDVDAGNTLRAVRIDSVQTAGSLRFNGLQVNAGQSLDKASIDAGQLVFLPTVNASGTGYSTFSFSVQDHRQLFSAISNVMTFDVIAANDTPTLVVNLGGNLSEGAGVTISSAQLAVTDPDNTAAQLTYTVTAIPANGALRLNGVVLAASATFSQDDINNSRISYLHDGSETTTDRFAFTVSDGAGGSIGATNFDIIINPSNDNSPIIASNGGGAIAVVSVAENSTSVTTVSATDADLPVQTLTYSIVPSADAARFSIDVNTGALSFVTAPDFEAPTDADVDNIYVVIVSASDGILIDQQVISVTVTNVNEGGAGAISDSDAALNSVSENAVVGSSVGVTARASDPDGSDSISYTLDSNAGGRFAIDAGTGIVTVAGALDYESSASHNIIVRATSTDGSFTTTGFTIDLVDQNDNAPVIPSGQSFSIIENSANGTNVGIVGATDVDSVGLIQNWAIVGGTGASAFAIDAATGQITVADVGQLNFETTPSFSLQLTVSDGLNTTLAQTLTINLTNANETPTVTNPIANQAATEDLTFSFQFLASTFNDVDAGDSLTYTASAAPPWLTFDAVTRTFSGTPANADVGATTITVRATDLSGAFVEDQFDLVVANANDAPTIVTNAGISLNEGASATITIAQLGVSDIDNTPDQLAFTTMTIPANGVLRLNGVALATNDTFTQDDIDNNRLSYLHDGSETGADAIQFTLSDGAGGSIGTTTFVISITPVNDNSPVITSDGGSASAAINVAETNALVTTVTASDADLPTQTISYSIVAGVDAAKFNIDSATGVLSFIVAPDFEAPADADSDNIYRVTIQASDGLGGTALQTIDVTVSNVNEAGVSAISDSNTSSDSVNENAAIGTSVGITADATDPDVSDSVTYSLDNDAGGLFAIDGATGIVTVAGALDYESATSHNILVRATSSDGSSSTRGFAVTVADSNDTAPMIGLGQIFSIAENSLDGAFVATAVATDPDSIGLLQNWTITGGSGSAVFAINATTGAITVADGTLLNYEVNPSYTLVLTVSDGVRTSIAQSITVNITNVNETPTLATPIANQSAAEDSLFSFTVPATTFSDVDLSDSLVYSASGGPAWLIFDTATHTFSGTPANADVGAVTVTVRATDLSGAFVEDQFDIVIANTNDAPIASGDSFNAGEDTVLNIIPSGILGNDGDAENDPLQAVLVSGPAHGTIALNANGSFTYTPNRDFNGLDSFSYLVNDGNLNSNVATVNIDVAAVNDLPNAVAVSVLGQEDSPYVFSRGDFRFIDVDGDALTAVRIESLPTLGQLRLNGANIAAGQIVTSAQIDSGNLVFRPSNNGNGAPYATLNFSVSDGSGFSGSQSLRVNIAAINDAPVLGLNSLSIFAGASVTLYGNSLSAFDSDTLEQDIIFHVASVRNGHFELSSNSENAVNSFSQAQLQAGLVRFVHDGSNAAPSYDVTINDGLNSIGPGRASISFFAAPPATGSTSDPAIDAVFTPVSIDSGNNPSSNQTNPLRDVTTREASADDVVNSEEGSLANAASDEPSLASGTVRGAAANSTSRALDVIRPSRTAEFRPIRPYSGGHWANDVNVVSTAPLRLEFGPVDGDVIVPVSGTFDPHTGVTIESVNGTDIDRFGDLSPEEQRNIQIVLNSTKLSGVALSVGAVWWATRAGGLLASLVASAPAWRNIDPLPIFGATTDEEDELYPEQSKDGEAERDDRAAGNLLDAASQNLEPALEGSR